MYKELVAAALSGLIAGALGVAIIQFLKQKNKNFSIWAAIIVAVLLGAVIGVLGALGYGNVYAIEGLVSGLLVVYFMQGNFMQEMHEKPLLFFGKVVLFGLLLGVFFGLAKILVVRFM